MSGDTVLEIEKSFWESSGDEDFYQKHVAEEGKFVMSMGVLDKADVVAAMAHADPWESYEIRDSSRIPISDDVVGLVYEASGRRDADSTPYQANILSVYRRNDENWQLILHQQTPVDSSRQST